MSNQDRTEITVSEAEPTRAGHNSNLDPSRPLEHSLAKPLSPKQTQRLARPDALPCFVRGEPSKLGRSKSLAGTSPAVSGVRRALIGAVCLAAFAIPFGCSPAADKKTPSPTATASATPNVPTQSQTVDSRLLLPVSFEGKSGFVNEHGQVVVTLQYDEVGQFSEHLAPIRLGQLWGYIEPAGTQVVEPRFKEARSLSDGRAAVCELSKKWGFLDASGTQVVAPTYDQVHSFSEGYAAVCSSSKWGFIDPSGKLSIALTYQDAGHFASGLAPVSEKGRWGFVDKSGTLVIAAQYAKARCFAQERAAVSDGKTWSFIDIEGKAYGPKGLVDVGDYSENLVAAAVEGEWGYLDLSGKFVIKPNFNEAGSFSEGLAPVRDDKGWSYIDTTGKTQFRLPAEVTKAESFTSGVAKVTYHKTACYICKTGEFVWNPINGKQENL
jgi:hypothetical protein